jgi:NAD(P)-dependent dehydrogenase (short-subunit alcohol dehydrogenase family)
MNKSTLRGRHAVITGGGHGLGAAIARALAHQGCDLTLMGRDRQRLANTAAQLAETHAVDAHAVECDVSDGASVERAFQSAHQLLGAAHILVNNAGQGEGAAFLDTTREVWDRLLAVNLTGTFLCTQAALPAMLAAQSGRIINIASTAGLKGYARVAAYCASKHGVVGLTRALAAEVARQGITVNAVCPAYTDTEMTDRTVESLSRARGWAPEEARKKLERLIPIGRLIKPEEVAHTVAWLCSPDAAAITGQAIAVAGGEVM